jgi:hypothetical protein
LLPSRLNIREHRPGHQRRRLGDTFFSVATNLVAEDTNICPVFQVPGQCADIFVHVETSG